MGKQKTSSWTAPNRLALIGLIATSMIASLLAVFQWMELIVTFEGGQTFCGIDETLNCAAVWQSEFAKTIQRLTRVPVAGWGLIWSLGAFFTAAHLTYAVLGRGDYDAPIFSVRLMAAGGVGAVLLLGGVSASLGYLCLTCLGTYALVAGYAYFAWQVKPTTGFAESKATTVALPVAASLAVSYAALLVPGTRTPVDMDHKLEVPVATKPPPASKTPPPTSSKAPPPAASQSPLAQYLKTLPPAAAQAVSDSLDKMRKSRQVDASKYLARYRMGPESAPVKFVDFSDIRCGHCRRLNEVMSQLEEVAPKGSFCSEPRFYPLDSGCNPSVPPELKDPTGVRCLAPKVLICIEDHPKYHDARDKMFEEQNDLTTDRVMEIAAQTTGKSKAFLKKCVAAPATAKKLAEDVSYANMYDVHGTPIVLVNGRQATSVAPFLYAMIIAKGNPNDPAFGALPPPRPDAHVH